MNWQERYEKIYEMPIYLEDVQHVYIHKKTGYRYISVTTTLSLIKNIFDDSVVEGLIRQYQGFDSWARKEGVSYSNDRVSYIRLLTLYTNYKNYREHEEGDYNGKKYKKYKKLKDYNLGDFLDEFEEIEASTHLDRLKVVYLNENGWIMNRKQIKETWRLITEVANIYGSMLHEVVEQYILLEQRFVIENGIEQAIIDKYNDLQAKLKAYINPHNLHIFKEYIIEESLEEFKQHIIDEFNKLGCDLGRVCVPECLMFNEEKYLAGMGDIVVDVDDNDFDIGDHKTNKDFTTSSPYDMKLKAPFEHLDDCDLHIYNLQLSLYAKMHELRTGKNLRKMWISYYSRLTKSFKLIKLKYLKKEAELLLEMHKEYIEMILDKYDMMGMLDDVPEKYHMHLSHNIEKTTSDINFLKKNPDLKDDMNYNAWMNNYVRKYLKNQDSIEIH